MLTKDPTNVTTMQRKLQMHQSTISKNLEKLKTAKIITSTRKRLEIYYEVVDNH